MWHKGWPQEAGSFVFLFAYGDPSAVVRGHMVEGRLRFENVMDGGWISDEPLYHTRIPDLSSAGKEKGREHERHEVGNEETRRKSEY